MAIVRASDAQEAFKGAFRFEAALVALAREHILATVTGAVAVPDIMKSFTDARAVNRFAQLILHDDMDLAEQYRSAAEFWAHRLAVAQAVQELVADGTLVGSLNRSAEHPNQAFTTVVGNSGGWDFQEFEVTFPDRVWRSPFSSALDPHGHPHLAFYAIRNSVQGADSEVQEAIEDALACFRKGLYLPAVVMLGKAAEGAWKEALAIAAVRLEPSRRKQLQRTIEDPRSGFADIIKRGRDTLTNVDLRPFLATAAVRHDALDSVVIWSEELRKARNTVHFGVKPLVPNDFAKAAVLFVAGADHLGLLYRLRDALRGS